MTTSTVGLSNEEPIHRQKSALADRQIYGHGPVDLPIAILSSHQDVWIAMLLGTPQSFANQISQEKVTHDLHVYSFLDENQLADCWRKLSHIPRRSENPVEEELLDWDIAIETRSTSGSTQIVARVEYRGRSSPKPVIDPWD